MRVIIQPDADAVSRCAARFFVELLQRKPNAVLGLATGSTPVATYRELIRLHQGGEIDFAHVTTFNLDEYVGLAPDHPQSYRRFMQEQLFSAINIRPERTHLPNGCDLDFAASCQAYEERIAAHGGIDLQLLGIGSDGHIAFNEPGSSLASRTRVKSLVAETIRDNTRFFGSEQEVPRLAVTMGVGTILEARQILLLATGESKAAAIAATIEGPITAQVTASALQLHRHTVVILDAAAASQLQRRDYYLEVERSQQLLEAGQFEALGIRHSR
ncbi:MAG: glucosamine-6-phosphate deaminase [Planctomycetota bacterium]